MEPSNVCPIGKKLYLHKFSDKYYVLIGRDYLNGCKAKISFKIR